MPQCIGKWSFLSWWVSKCISFCLTRREVANLLKTRSTPAVWCYVFEPGGGRHSVLVSASPNDVVSLICINQFCCEPRWSPSVSGAKLLLVECRSLLIFSSRFTMMACIINSCRSSDFGRAINGDGRVARKTCCGFRRVQEAYGRPVWTQWGAALAVSTLH